MLRLLAFTFCSYLPLIAAAGELFHLTARASEIDSRCQEHPEIGYIFGSKDKPQDLQHAFVDTRVAARGQLVIWLMAPNPELFRRTAGYGLHTIQVHYARGWFGKLYPGKTPPDDDLFLSKVRLEAATGEDFSDAIEIPRPDGLRERASQLVRHLAQKNPEGHWEQFLTGEGEGLDWEKVIISGASHGATTAARFAKHQKVARVVMLCGPRDQFESWQSLPSATPPQRFFAFSHVLDSGWSGDHYPRSWQMLGLQAFGPIVDVDTTAPPYLNSRRLTTAADVGGDANRAHGSVSPGKRSPKDASGKALFEDVWRYLYTHPVDATGEATPTDPQIRMNQR